MCFNKRTLYIEKTNQSSKSDFVSLAELNPIRGIREVLDILGRHGKWFLARFLRMSEF